MKTPIFHTYYEKQNMKEKSFILTHFHKELNSKDSQYLNLSPQKVS